jgi:hypothetical protein
MILAIELHLAFVPMNLTSQFGPIVVIGVVFFTSKMGNFLLTNNEPFD